MNAYQTPVDPTAVAGKRIVSAIIDVGIGWLIYFVLFAILAEHVSNFGGVLTCEDINTPGRSCVSLGDDIWYTRGWRSLLLSGIMLGYFFGVFILQRGLTGKTLGTIAMGIVTVDERGNAPGIAMALVRSVAGIVDCVPCCVPLVGIIMILTRGDHRRVGDMAARTFVVDKQYSGQPVVVPGTTASSVGGPYGQPFAAPHPQAPYTPQAPYAPQAPYTQGTPGAPPAAPSPGQVTQGQPQWDPSRNAYVQWDPAAQRWLMFDAVTQQWRPVE